MEWPPSEFLTAALVVITGIYAALTFGILKATNRSVEAVRAQTGDFARPYITVAPMFLPNSVLIYLSVKNTGRSGASAVRLRTDRSFYAFGQPDEDISELKAFKSEIASFGPGVELVFALVSAIELYDPKADRGKLPLTFGVTATYNFGNQEYSERTEVDLRPFEGMQLRQDPLINELRSIGRELKDIADELRKK